MSRFPASDPASNSLRAAQQPQSQQHLKRPKVATSSAQAPAQVHTHYAGILVFRKDSERPEVWQLLILPIIEDRGSAKPGESLEQRVARLMMHGACPQLKFPGGTNRGRPGETNPHDTVRREFTEEVGGEVKALWKKPLLTVPKGPYHTQHFYECGPNTDTQNPDWTGEIRTTIQLEQERGRPDEILLPPRFMDVADLEQKIFPSHAAALMEFLKKYAESPA